MTLNNSRSRYDAAGIVNHVVSTGKDLKGSDIGLKAPGRAKKHNSDGIRCLKLDSKRVPQEHEFTASPLNQSFRQDYSEDEKKIM
jgi:hypothetical protein